MSMTGRGGPEGDPMDLYQVFQSSYNKITKHEYSESYPSAHEQYQDSRYFPLEARAQCKSEKVVDERQWYGETSQYPDPSVYYPAPLEQDWAVEYPQYPTEPPALQSYSIPGAGFSPAPSTYPRPSGQHNQLDDAIHILRNHVDFSQVKNILQHFKTYINPF